MPSITDYDVAEFDELPAGSMHVCAAIHETLEEIDRNICTKRNIVERTHLDRHQVRYRLDQLAEMGIVEQSSYQEHRQIVHHYYPAGNEMEALCLYFYAGMDALDEIPEEVSKEDLVVLTGRLESLESRVEALED